MSLDLKNNDFKKEVLTAEGGYERITKQIKGDLSGLYDNILKDFNDENEDVSVDIEPAKIFLDGLKDKEFSEIQAKGAAWAFAVQLLLKEKKDKNGDPFYKGKVDGIYGGSGGKTRAAVKKFQESVGFEGKAVDGWAGGDTIKKLLDKAKGVSESTTKGTEAIVEETDDSTDFEILNDSSIVNFTGKGKFTREDGTVYEGDWVNGKRTGKGKFTREDKTVYEGDFQDGARTGTGKYTRKDGDVYVGAWLNGKRTGKGKFSRTNGDVYVGDFLDGARTGKGEYTRANGDIYVGDFLDGARTGTGEYTRANGDVYVGDFQDGARTGTGKYTRKDGDVYVGSYRFDVRIENPKGFDTVYKSLKLLDENFFKDFDINTYNNIALLNKGLNKGIFDNSSSVFHKYEPGYSIRGSKNDYITLNEGNINTVDDINETPVFEVDGTGSFDDYRFDSVETFFVRLKKEVE